MQSQIRQYLSAAIFASLCAAATYAEQDVWNDVRYLPYPALDLYHVDIDIDGDWAILAGRTQTFKPTFGVAHYERTGSGWVSRGHTYIPRPFGGVNDRAVALKGATAAFVATDRIWILRRTDGVWAIEQTIFVPLGGPGEDILHADLASEDTLVIGSPNTATDGALGHVFVYTRDAADGVWRETLRIPNPRDNEPHDFGRQVAADGARIAVAAPGYDGDQIDQGAIYLFDINNLEGTPDAMLVRPDPRANDRLGRRAVSLHAGRLAAATDLLDFTLENFVCVFSGQGTAWSHTTTFSAADFPGADGDPASFGRTIEAVRDGVMIGWFDAAAGGTMPLIRPGTVNFARFENEDLIDRRTWVFNHNAVGFFVGYVLGSDGERVIAGGPGTGPIFRPAVISRESECFRDLRGDANDDGVINFEDLNIVLSQFEQTGENLQGDVTGNGVVDFLDLNFVIVLYGSPCLPSE